MAISQNMTSGNSPRKRAPKTSQIRRTRSLILRATAELLPQLGYRGLTIEKISEHGGIARSTIYRHWRSLSDIVKDAIREVFDPIPDLPETGNLRDDLVKNARQLSRSLTQTTWGDILPSLVEAARQDKEISALLTEYSDRRRRLGKKILSQAIERGEIPYKIDADVLLDQIEAPLYYRYLVMQKPASKVEQIEKLVHNALHTIGYNFETGEAGQVTEVHPPVEIPFFRMR